MTEQHYSIEHNFSRLNPFADDHMYENVYQNVLVIPWTIL